MKRAALLLFSLSPVYAQQPLPNQPGGNISGTVVISRSDTPVADAEVSLDPRSKTEMKTTTDSGGHYEFRDVPAGEHHVTAMKSPDGRVFRAAMQDKRFTLNPGETLSSVNFQLPLKGTISGRIFDENKEPMTGMQVLLVAREYAGGALHYVYAGAAMSNDRGEYTLGGVDPGRGYLVEAKRRQFKLPAVSDSPADPRLRRRVPAPSFIPGRPRLTAPRPSR